jgi:hypothetical protein
MGPGDQAGTWGSTTNNNFQYIFEQAIAGLQVVSVTTTPQALTYLNGATPTLANNQAICAVLQLSNGGVGANFTLTTPSGAQKTYVVFNNTAYVATMQVTGSSGSTIAIPAGVTATVYTDGTNFYAGSTGTVGSFSVNGALSATGSVTASNHIGAGTGLTGTATSLSIGGNAATATSATTASALTSSGVLTVLAAAYPVGSIYMNTSSGTNPATLLGFGTWTALAAGQMLLGNGGGYTAGNTGGSATTTLTTANMPSHTHAVNDPGHTHTYTFKSTTGGTLAGEDPNSVGNVSANTGTAFTGITLGTAGSGTSFTTISPYLVVYMWQRTA